MRTKWLVTGWGLLASALLALAEPPISGPAEVGRDKIAVLLVNLKNDTDTKSAVRRLEVKPAGLDVVKSDDGLKWYVAGKPGVYTITGEVFVRKYKDGVIVDFDFQDIDYSIRVTGEPDPTPPDPGPNPPGPTPDPGTSPIDADGLNVLVVVDNGMLNLNREQLTTLDGAEFKTYLAGACPKDKTGQSAWRIYEKKTVVGPDEDERWRKAFARGQKELPWLVVGNRKKGGSEGPLPKTKAEIMSEIKKWEGN